jgi:hypothetical protein
MQPLTNFSTVPVNAFPSAATAESTTKGEPFFMEQNHGNNYNNNNNFHMVHLFSHL